MIVVCGKVTILCFVLFLVSVAWIRVTGRMLTPEQLINRDYPYWIMIPTYVIEICSILGTITLIIWVIGSLFFK